MPGLRKLFVSFRKGSSEDVDDGQQSRLRKKNDVVPGKNTNIDDSQKSLATNEAVLDPEEPSPDDASDFEDAVEHFEAELIASALRPRPHSEHTISRPSSGDNGAVLVSKHGLTVNTAAAASRSIFGSSREHISPIPRPVFDTRDSVSSISNIPVSQVSSVDNAYINGTEASSPITAQSSYDEQNPVGLLPPPEGSKVQGKKRLIPIRELDWSKLAENEASGIAKAYGASSSLYSASVVSPRATQTSHSAIADWKANHPDDVLQGAATLRLPHKQSMVNNWLNKQDFSDELLDFEAEEAAERQEQALMDELKLLRAQEVAKQVELQRIQAEKLEEAARLRLEEERLATEELIRKLEEAEQVRLAAALAEARARMRDCVVCGDSKGPFDFSARTPALRCEHPPQTCTECVQSWMASEFETKGCDGIKCPECAETLEHHEVQAAASAETFAAYDRLAMRNALGASEEFAWCLKPDCGSGQMNIDNNAFMDCASCGYKQCLTHKVAWHTGETCAQYEYRTSGEKARDEERQTEEMLDSISKKCPNVKCGW